MPVRFGNLVGLAFLDELEQDEAKALLTQRRLGLSAALDQVRSAPIHSGS